MLLDFLDNLLIGRIIYALFEYIILFLLSFIGYSIYVILKGLFNIINK